MTNQEEVYDVAIIGGGAAGMTAALSAAQTLREHSDLRPRIALFERNDRVGKKLLTTGNGRCNLTNRNVAPNKYHGTYAEFCLPILTRYSTDKILTFFEDLGVLTVELEEGKLYPRTLQASSVLDALRYSLTENTIQLISDTRIQSVRRNGTLFALQSDTHDSFVARSVIVSCGGAAAPSSGSDGSGYCLLTDFSHTLIPPLPSIVQVKADTSVCKPLSGQKITGTATLYVNKQPKRKEEGEILFTDYGLSGPAILQLSGLIARGIQAKEGDFEIGINLMPEYDLQSCIDLILTRTARFAERPLEDLFTGVLGKRISTTLIKRNVELPLKACASSLTYRDIRGLASAILDFRIQVQGTLGFAQAQVTAGGICTEEFDPTSLESQIVPGLFACGEVLDIDGDCGGYNLHWAWASGLTAGNAAAAYGFGAGL